jgi:hypothetical protein
LKIELNHYPEWAERSGYKIYPFRNDSTRPPISSKYDFLSNIKTAKEILFAQESTSPVIIECKNIKLVVWNHPEPAGHHTYTYYLISENGDLLLDEPTSSEYWLRYSPVLFYSENSWHIRDEYLSPIELMHFNDPPIFCGGSSHYAHWVSDTLSNFFIGSEAGFSATQFLSSIHTRYQNEALETLGFFNKKNNIHFIDMEDKNCRIFQCDKLLVVANFGIRDRFSLLREIISKRYPHEGGNKICYMPRGSLRGQKRIANEDEVLKFCSSSGIEIVDGTYLTFRECIEKFSQYSLFISGPSAANTNFSLFSHSDSKFLYGLASAYQASNSWAVLASAWYMLPKLNETEIVLLDMEPGSEHQLPFSKSHNLPITFLDPVIFDLELLASKIEEMRLNIF